MHASNNVACECFKGSGTAWELKFLGERAMKKYLKGFLGLSLCAGLATLAYAAVDYDPEFGGYVGKGDVQSAFGWSNKELQAKGESVEFAYRVTADWTGECAVFERGQVTKSGTVVDTYATDKSVDFDVKKKNQINGFFLGAAQALGQSGVPKNNNRCDVTVDDERYEGKWQNVVATPVGELIVTSDGRTEVLATY
jgi:hypothetical protein